MAKVGVSEAAQLVGKSRQTLYRLMDQGKLAFDSELIVGRTGEGGKDDYSRVIDVAELQRVFGELSHGDSNADSQKLHHETRESDNNYKVLEVELKAAREALRDREDQLREAKDREDWLKKQVEELTGTIKLIEHKPDAQPDPLQAATLAARLQELENDARQFKENEAKLLAERKQMRSELLQEKAKSWWQKLRGQ